MKFFLSSSAVAFYLVGVFYATYDIGSFAWYGDDIPSRSLGYLIVAAVLFEIKKRYYDV